MNAIRKKTISLFIIVLIGGSLFNSVFAAEEESSLTPQAALQLLKNGNARFAEDRPELKDIDQARRSELVKGQHPFAIVLTCADSHRAGVDIQSGIGAMYLWRE